MIEALRLSKTFGNRRAIDSVTFHVPERACLLLHGTAGAGKTTLLRLLATVIVPTSGTIRIAGHDAESRLTEIRQHVALCDLSLPGGTRLRVDEYLQWLAKARPDANRSSRRAVLAPGLAARRAALPPSCRIDTLSRHHRAALAVAAAAVLPVSVLLLDEVIDSFAVDRRLQLLEWLRELRAAGATLVITSRDAAAAHDVSTHSLHLCDGQISDPEAAAANRYVHRPDSDGTVNGVADLA